MEVRANNSVLTASNIAFMEYIRSSRGSPPAIASKEITEHRMLDLTHDSGSGGLQQRRGRSGC
jgi:hypothetical protein